MAGYRRRRRVRQGAARRRSATVQRPLRQPLRDARRRSPPRSGSLVFTGDSDDPETLATLARLGFANPADVTRDDPRLALRPLSRHALGSGARTADRAHAGAARGARRHRQRRRGASPPSTGSWRACRPACSSSRCSAPIPACSALIATILGTAPRLAETDHRSAPTFSTRCSTRPSSAACRSASVARRALAASLAEATSLRGRARPRPHLRPGAGLPDRRPACSPAPIGAAPGRARLCRPRRSPRRRAPRRGRREVFAGVHGTMRGGRPCVLAMGKLGGREMTAASDLDLIAPLRFRRRDRRLRRRAAARPAGSTTRG